MLQTIFSYVVGLGPYYVLALGLGIVIPILLLVTHPSRWLLVAAILFLCLVPVGGNELAGPAEGSLFRQVGWGSVFLLALYQALRQNGKFNIPWAWIPIPYLLLLVYALVSVAWSEVPWVSAKRAVQLVGVLFIALALVRLAETKNPLATFAWPGLFFLLLGVAALVVPGLSIDPDGNYRGFTFTKNVWGQFALLMSLVFMFLALGKVRPRLNWWLFVFSSLSLIATKSATSILLYIMAIGIVLNWVIARQQGRTYLVVTLSTLFIGVLALFAYFIPTGHLPFDAVFQAGMVSIGKDPTLTGRTMLWRWMGYEIDSHPWFGAGYGGFWMGLEGPSYNIVRFFSWRPGQAHNGYIDVINELGYVGMGLLIIVLLRHLYNIYVLSRRYDRLIAVFYLAVFVTVLLLNVSESNFMRTTHLWWIVLTVSIVHAHALTRTTLTSVKL